MRKLSVEKKTSILSCLVEGTGINATARICSVSKLTVLRLLADVGSLCRDYHDLMVQNLNCRRIECDEIWSFVGCKQRNKNLGKTGDGDCWTWVALDADSKLVVSYLVGLRDSGHAFEFIHDVASRIENRIQLTTDGLRLYVEAIEDAFGGGIDYAMLVKLYGKEDRAGEARYSPAKCIGCKPFTIVGKPNPNCISTSYIERQNLTVRMQNRRFTRLTNAFSKKWANHEHAIALHYFYYNFCRKHQSIGTTPAVAAGITEKVWTIHDFVNLLVDEENKLAMGGRINKKDRK
ncbi:MAG: IS1 family transposase [Sedimentisphaerales bacterium]|nr:IS1 family transposase [Sedimentisphaerales bacterium]